MSLLDLQFQNIALLYLLVPAVGLVAYLFFMGSRKRKTNLKSILTERLQESFTEQVSTRKRRFKQIIVLLGIALIIAAIARPQLGYFWEESPQETTDVIIALDTSKSMLAPDLKPSRLARAKLEIEDFVKNLKGVRLGLIPFAGDAFLWCPLTYDTEAFLETLRGVDTNIIPTGGTNILSALETAEISFKSDESAAKMMILITDGEDLEGQVENKLPEFSRKGWIVHTIGIGTEEGELIPITKEDGSTTYVTDAEGNVVKSKLDAATLQMIAEKTGGTYHALGATGEGLYELFENVIRGQLEAREESRLRKIPIERYSWLVIAAIILLAIELLLKDRKSRLKRNHSTVALVLVTLSGYLQPSSMEGSQAREAQEAFFSGNFEKAETLYQAAAVAEPEKLQTQYNLGVSAMQNGNLSVAKQALDLSLNTTDLELQQPAYYNRGTVNYLLGRQVLDSNPQETVKYWEASIKDYQNALALNPEDQDASDNKTEVERLLEELKKLLQNQNQDQNQDQQQNQNQDQQDQQQNQDQQDQNQDQNQDQQDQQQNQDQQDQNQQQQQNQEQDQQQGQDKDQEQQEQQQEEENQEQQQNSEEQQEKEQQQQQGSEEEKNEDKQEDKEEQPSGEDQAGQQPQAQQTNAQPAGNEEENNAEKLEALRLLESLKNEDGDGKELIFKLQNPEPDQDTTKQDW